MERLKKAVVFMIGMTTTLPLTVAGSSEVPTRRAPSIPTYSAPCTPPETVTRGPSCVPLIAMIGTSTVRLPRSAWTTCIRRSPGGTVKPATSRLAGIENLLPHQSWIEDIAQGITQEIEAQGGKKNRHPGERRDPLSGEHVIAAIGEHRPPIGSGRLRAQSQEGEARGLDDRQTDRE